MTDVIKIDTDRRWALTKEEFTKLRDQARLAPEAHCLDAAGTPQFQVTIPSQWLRCLLSTIEHGYRDPKEQVDAEKAA